MKSPVGATLAASPWFTALVLVGLAGNLAAWLWLAPLPDEAYYWVWSQRLQFGYFDHPPLIAWMIRPFTDLFGNNGWAMRLPAVLGWFVCAGFAWVMAERLWGNRRAALLAVVIWTSLPIVQIGVHVNTPDTPAVLFTWAAFFFALRAVERQTLAEWLAAGLCAGLALTGKYTAALVPGALFLALLLTRAGRGMLATRGPWLAAVTALLVFAPVIYWNWQRDWISFAFQFHHGVQTELPDPGPMFLAFLSGQWAAVLPWTWLAMAFAALPRRAQVEPMGTTRFAILAAGFWVPLLLFGFFALTSKSHPNWPVLAYVPGSLLLAGLLERWLGVGRPWRARAVVAAYLFGVVVINLMRFPQWLQAFHLDLPAQRTQLSQAYDWQEVGPEVKRLLAGRDECVVVGDRLQSTAMLALILDDPDRVVVSGNTRLNQFHLWQRERPVAADSLCLYVAQYEEDERVPEWVDLPDQGRWRLMRLLTVHNPDLSVRHAAFFVPVRSDRPPALGYNAGL